MKYKAEKAFLSHGFPSKREAARTYEPDGQLLLLPQVDVSMVCQDSALMMNARGADSRI